jgi:VanZ family protein
VERRAAPDGALGFRGALSYWGPLAVWLGAIFFFSTDAASVGRTSRYLEPLIRWLLPWAVEATVFAVHVAVRKAGHVFEYGLLALLAYRAMRRGRARAWSAAWAAWAFLLSAGYALVDEYHQTFTTSRSGDLGDVLIDCAGAAAAMIFLAKWPSTMKYLAR